MNASSLFSAPSGNEVARDFPDARFWLITKREGSVNTRAFLGTYSGTTRLAHDSGRTMRASMAACKRRQFARAFLSLLERAGVKEELIAHDQAVLERNDFPGYGMGAPLDQTRSLPEGNSNSPDTGTARNSRPSHLSGCALISGESQDANPTKRARSPVGETWPRLPGVCPRSPSKPFCGPLRFFESHVQ